jgi:uncharacterized protein YecA (UPF0149 family)
VDADIRNLTHVPEKRDKDTNVEDKKDNDIEIIPSSESAKKHRLVKIVHHKSTYHKNVLPGRNDKCLCGSGKKFKKCCLAKVGQQ